MPSRTGYMNYISRLYPLFQRKKNAIFLENKKYKNELNKRTNIQKEQNKRK